MLMADIARLAGVSTSTVSRALSGNPLIKPDTRERIAELARSMNYQINVGAANLRKRDVQTVGVAVLGDDLQLISDPFILSLVGHIADALDRRGMSLLLSRVSVDRRHTLATQVESGQVAGLIVVGQMTCHPYLNELAGRDIPMVVWGARLPDARYCVIGCDNEQGGYLATRHLLERGCRRIAFLGDVVHPEVMLRHKGYACALAELGLQPDPQLYKPILFQDHALRQAIGNWVAQDIRFDGVFATSDVAAMSVIAALTERGLQVPRDVKVVGYDDIAMSAHLHPSITSIRQPTHLAGETMVQMLFDLMADEQPGHIMLPAQLIERDSSQSDLAEVEVTKLPT
jgi:DNA-binding LacI/PurR family transcriptional regulator